MKSVFNKIEKEKSKEIEFPVLAESICNNFVVMFVGETQGVVVKGDFSSAAYIGTYSNAFMPVEDSSVWRILSPEESIVLSND